MALRAMPDRFVVPKDGRPTFWIDFKTSWKYKLYTSNNREAMTFESLQIALHKAKYEVGGVPCMYIARDKEGVEAAFWCHDIHEISELLRPSDTPYSKDL